MASVIHIAEIAAILAVAYMLGWVIGYVVHRLLAPETLVQAAIPEARLAAATGTTEALVKAPVIAPVADPAAETPAAPVPAEAATTLAPADTGAAASPVEAIATGAPAESGAADAVTEQEPVTSTPDPAPVMAEPPLVPGPAPAESEPSAPQAQVETAAPATPGARGFRRFRPTPKPAPAPWPVADVPPSDFTSTPASQPGVAWTGEIRGRSAIRVAAEESVAPSAEVVPAVPDESLPTEPAMAVSSEPVVEPSPPPIELEPRPEPVVAAPPSPAQSTPVYDEDAAMRAIEGGWSRVKARAMPEAPELSDLGAAVAAATTAVEQVLAKAGIDIDSAAPEERPKGLGRPRNGVKDDLKRIVGLGALDESTLNNLGVYHYEQIARWNAAQVAWMENHVFARGRIAREDWQSQARALIPPPSF